MQAFQSVMVAHEVYEHKLKEFKKIETEHDRCATRIQIA